MARELEAKFKVASLAAVRAALDSAGAEPLGEQVEVNHMLDRPTDPLAGRDCALRVRERRLPHGGVLPAQLTYKGPAQAARFKSREELEIHVDDAAGALEILKRIGFTETLVYEKRRESWRLNDCRVELDELPGLGCFVEIEGPSEAALDASAGLLGLAGVPHVAGSYVHLLLAQGGGEPGTRAFRFRG